MRQGIAVRSALKSQAVAPLKYASAKPADLLEVDKAILQQKLSLKPEAIELIPASSFMEK